MCLWVCASEISQQQRETGILPSSDEEEEGKDDQQGKASDRCCDNHQNLTLVSNIKVCGKWDQSQGEAKKTSKYVPVKKNNNSLTEFKPEIWHTTSWYEDVTIYWTRWMD